MPVKELVELCDIIHNMKQDKEYEWKFPEHVPCVNGKCEGYDTKCNYYTPVIKKQEYENI